MSLQDYKKQTLDSQSAIVMKMTNPEYRNTYFHFLFSHLKHLLTCKMDYTYHNTTSEVLITTSQPPE